MDVHILGGDLSQVSDETLVMLVWEEGLGDNPSGVQLQELLGLDVEASLQSGAVSDKLYKTTTLLASGGSSVQQLIVIGAGKQPKWNNQTAKNIAGAVVRTLKSLSIAQATLALPSIGDPVANIAAMVHGAVVADFSTGSYKTRDTDERSFDQLTILAPTDDAAELEAAAEKSRIIGEACNLARTLANEPGNKLTPTIFAAEAQQVADANGLAIHVMEEAEMKDNGYGAILGVSRGSHEPAKLVTLRYEADPSAAIVGLVGKGITFDSGGLSIKTADGMIRMKTDMSGASSVLGAMQAIAQLQPSVNVVGVLCLSENMPSSTSMKPGDILTAGNGMTIEVLNTDAEGRLVLADGLTHARAQGATHLVDVATLTGACVVALGSVTTGVFGSDQGWTDMLLDSAKRMGEKMWQLPLYPEYREQLNSDIADIANVGGREAGAITAATFLREFAADSAWVHLDIAGTSWIASEKPYTAKGPTGVAVPTLVQLVQLVGTNGLPQ